MKSNIGHELEWFKRWEGGTLWIWYRQMIKRPRKIIVYNDYFFDGMRCRLFEMEQGVQTSMQNLENTMNNFNKLNIIIWIG
jgi:hypothetical protein